MLTTARPGPTEKVAVTSVPSGTPLLSASGPLKKLPERSIAERFSKFGLFELTGLQSNGTKSVPADVLTVAMIVVSGNGLMKGGSGWFASNGKPFSAAEWPTLCGTIGSENSTMNVPRDEVELALSGSVGSLTSDAIEITK